MGKPIHPPTRRTLARFVFQAGVLAGIMLLSLSGYLLILKWRGPAGAARTTWTPWDEYIPFAPAWVWVYFLPYLIGPILVGILSRDTFAWFIRRGLVVVFVTLVIFVIYPTQTVRPMRHDLGDGLTARLYENMVTIDDPPANAAPSFHVSLTCLLAWALVRDFPCRWLAAFTGAGVVWLAALLTWQHHLIDVGTGVLLATAAATPWRSSITGAAPPRPASPSPVGSSGPETSSTGQ